MSVPVSSSPTGCSLYGTRMWSKKRRWCCRVSLWLTAPLLAFVLSVVVVPIILIVLPLGLGYKVGMVVGYEVGMIVGLVFESMLKPYMKTLHVIPYNTVTITW